MEPMNAWTYITLLVTLLLTTITQISAKPAANRLDYSNYYSQYPTIYSSYPKIPCRFDTTIGNIKRGYYYIDNGRLIPVQRKDALAAAAAAAHHPPAGKRRQDSLGNTGEASNVPDAVKFTPLVRIKQTETKRKKLFVPNFFG